MAAVQSGQRQWRFLAILFAGGAFIAAAYLAAGRISDSLQQRQLREIGIRWTTEISRLLSSAPALDWPTIGRRLATRLSRDWRPLRPRQITIYDAAGTRLTASTPTAASGLRGGIGTDDGDRAAIAAALAGKTVRNRVVEKFGDRSRSSSDIYLPVRLGKAGDGVLRILANDTGRALLPAATFQTYSAAIAAIGWFVFLVPMVIAWRRARVPDAGNETDIHFFALHDPLTGLPNRLQFNEKLADALLRTRRHRKRMAVMFLDLDRFKEINDTFGHPAGDELLGTVARRLRETVREMDTIGRLGGDEFAIIAEDLEQAQSAGVLARRICHALGQPYDIGGHQLSTSVSIGIAVAPDDGEDAETLVKNADLALYRAKGDGRNTFRFFEPEMDATQQRRLRMEREMRLAFEAGEFSLAFQPQYDLHTGQLCGYEAIPAWHHDECGEITADVFLPIAEESGLIIRMGDWILNEACRAAIAWPQHVKASIALSPVQFRSKHLADSVTEALRLSGLEPHRLELAFTEKLLLQDAERMLTILARLHNLGVSITMSEFGIGYSSLGHLAQIPFSNIKINRNFIEKLEREPESTAVVNSIIGLGRSLDVTITADGVDTPQQAKFLKELGCDRVQGLLYGQPDPTPGAAPFIATEPSAAISLVQGA